MCREMLAEGAHEDERLYVGALYMQEKGELRIVAMATAHDKHGVTGWAWVAKTGLLCVWVKARCRDKGLGRELTQEVKKSYKKKVHAGVEKEDEAAAFFRKVGVRIDDKR